MAETRDGRAEEFKRVLSTAMKTIAEEPELSVSFGNEAPALTGNKAKLPQVTNQFTPKDIAITRGLSDSFALRLSNHSDQVHNKYLPEGKSARAVFETVEQARIEALGAIAMPGMAQNLNAALEDRFSKAAFRFCAMPGMAIAPKASMRACSTVSKTARALFPSGRYLL